MFARALADAHSLLSSMNYHAIVTTEPGYSCLVGRQLIGDTSAVPSAVPCLKQIAFVAGAGGEVKSWC
jgi:hypothetical protein